MADSEPTNDAAGEGGEKSTTSSKNKRSPSDFLKSVLGRPAVVKLNSGVTYRGVLASLDGFLNIAMEQTSEYGLDGEMTATYGDCFIRGNNVLFISPQKKK
jgi:U6 snRNA-associated Sm-like protein LSm6